jgi:membrane-bound lytic murein transglycosylase MltF
MLRSVLLILLLTTAVPAADADDNALRDANETWTGDLDGMAKRGFVRILTVHNPLFFTFDGVEQRGLAVELTRAFDEHLANELGRVRSPTVILIPVARDQLLPGLLAGKGDLVVANLTITPERQKLVEFSAPTYPNISELVVTGPAAANVATFDDLAKTGLQLRRSSSYFEHIQQLNSNRERAGKNPIPVEFADENLEDYDLLDMVNAGLLPGIVVDSHKATFWAQVFPKIVVHDGLAIHTGNSVGWAFRKNSPQLEASLGAFVKTVRKGTLLGNIALKRYLGNANWIENSLSSKHRERYEEVVALIKRYAAKYDFDWLMIMAQGYQESRLDQSKRSSAGALGVMQVLPTTAADPVVGIPDISTAENNIHAGVKYLRWIRDRYFSSDEIAPVDKILLSFAAYNAGPRNVARARKKASQLGFDPNRWFGHVEVAMFRTVGGEPASYVRNIYKYYVAYRGFEQTRLAREKSRRGTQ